MMIVKNSITMFIKQASTVEPAYQTFSPREIRHRPVPGCTVTMPSPISAVCVIQNEYEGVPCVTLLLKISSFEQFHSLTSTSIFTEEKMREIHLVTRQESNQQEAVFTYQFRFQTRFAHQDSILQSFLGMIHEFSDDTHEFRQTYTVTRVDHRFPGKDLKTVLGTGLVSPTPHDFCELENGHRAFVGQRSVKSDPYLDSLIETFTTSHHTRKTVQKETQPLFMILQVPQFAFGENHTFIGAYSTQSCGDRNRSLMFTSRELHSLHLNSRDRQQAVSR